MAKAFVVAISQKNANCEMPTNYEDKKIAHIAKYVPIFQIFLRNIVIFFNIFRKKHGKSLKIGDLNKI
ncbi:MAG: hypothetical protein L6U16_03810 [Porphyromonadaceae bacterium]|nr:MAG: hypothetical protein L6U16_03810 [Porphyromonadaceae bacterium]